MLCVEHFLKKKLVVSAVNFTEGGPLAVLRECLHNAVIHLGNDWDIVALVHDRTLFSEPSVTFLEFPSCKFSWLTRLHHEWFKFKPLSRTLNADLWLSLHDITPVVVARRQAVYCHNPAPFYQLTRREARLEPTLFVFNKLYGWVYRLNIQRNHHVVVQQNWLRKQFERRYNAPGVIVAHPVATPSQVGARRPPADKTVFLYPALPRVFKNFEVILKATEILNQRGITNFEVQLTIDGSENRYAAELLERFAGIDHVCFLGRQNKDAMASRYQTANCLLFPSRLETWGLPVTEAQAVSMPMLVADLPYAYETVGSYDQVRFFPPQDDLALADLMQQMIAGTIEFSPVEVTPPHAPFARDWPALLHILVDGL